MVIRNNQDDIGQAFGPIALNRFLRKQTQRQRRGPKTYELQTFTPINIHTP